jgi:hypothetical protein
LEREAEDAESEGRCVVARYSIETKLGAEEAIEKAAAYFGEGGLGLTVVEQGSCCVRERRRRRWIWRLVSGITTSRDSCVSWFDYLIALR